VATVAMNLIQPIWTTPALDESTSLLGRLDGHTANPWLVIAVVILPGTVFPFFLEMVALRHLPATIVIVVAMLEPVIANVLGWAWFRESLTPIQVLGAVAVLAGIVLAQTSRKVSTVLPQP
jgi:drug/metabolite transporter (DMT)-like permease